MRVILGLLAAVWFAQIPTPAPATQPIVSVWYRGTPAGTPRQEELAVIRALGFGGVVWPASQPSGLEAMKKMAAAAGLKVTVGTPPTPVTPASLLASADHIDLVVGTQSAAVLTMMAWRAVAHGVRAIAFDAGGATGAGLENADRSLRPWAHAAIDLARQFSVNGRLIESFRPGPGLIVTPESSPALDVVMLDADRAWVLIATNASASPMVATVRLPAGAPYAIWVNLLDASTLAMNGEAAGPRWNLHLDARATRVYLIDKMTK